MLRSFIYWAMLSVAVLHGGWMSTATAQELPQTRGNPAYLLFVYYDLAAKNALEAARAGNGVAAASWYSTADGVARQLGEVLRLDPGLFVGAKDVLGDAPFETVAQFDATAAEVLVMHTQRTSRLALQDLARAISTVKQTAAALVRLAFQVRLLDRDANSEAGKRRIALQEWLTAIEVDGADFLKRDLAPHPVVAHLVREVAKELDGLVEAVDFVNPQASVRPLLVEFIEAETATMNLWRRYDRAPGVMHAAIERLVAATHRLRPELPPFYKTGVLASDELRPIANRFTKVAKSLEKVHNLVEGRLYHAADADEQILPFSPENLALLQEKLKSAENDFGVAIFELQKLSPLPHLPLEKLRALQSSQFLGGAPHLAFGGLLVAHELLTARALAVADIIDERLPGSCPNTFALQLNSAGDLAALTEVVQRVMKLPSMRGQFDPLVGKQMASALRHTAERLYSVPLPLPR